MEDSQVKKTFVVEYSGYKHIEAESKEDAMRKFLAMTDTEKCIGIEIDHVSGRIEEDITF